MLQQNWALIVPGQTGRAQVDSITDTSGIFGSLPFASVQDAMDALKRNGFVRYADDAGNSLC